MNFSEQLIARFHQAFPGNHSAASPAGPAKVRVIRAPGRVNLIGEHTDYNDGYVFPMAIEPEVRIACRARSDMRVSVASTRRPGDRVEFALTDTLRPNPEAKHWSNYLMGPIHFLKEAGIPLVGMDALVDNTLPEGSGLSSSAALEVAVVRSMLALAGEEMDYTRVALICQKAEHAFPKAPVGIMDMTASAGGKAGHAMLLDCRSMGVTYVPLPADDLRVVIINTMVSHSLAGGTGEYAQRRKQCEEAAAHFKVRALRDIDMTQLSHAEKDLHVVVYRRARHVVGEIERCLECAAALRDGDYERAGTLMNASHVSLRDDYEVSCDELDFIADEAVKVRGVYGARMTGGGFGGSAVALCQPRAVEPLIDYIAPRYKEKFGIEPQILATAATEGAGEVG